VDPMDVPRIIDGGNGNDTLNFDCRGVVVTDDGASLNAAGFSLVTYANFEKVNIFGVFCEDLAINIPDQGVSE